MRYFFYLKGMGSYMKNNVLKILTIIMVIIIIILLILFIFPKIKENDDLKGERKLEDKILTEISYADNNIIESMNKLNNIDIVRYKIYSEKININNNQNGDSNSQENSNSSEQSENKNSESQSQQSQTSGSQGLQNSQANSSQSSQNNSSQESSSSTPNETYNIQYNNSLTETNQNNIDWDNIEYIYENIFISWQTMQIDLNEEKVNSELISKYNSNLNGVANSIVQQNKESAMINYLNLYSDICDIVKYISSDQKMQNLFYSKLYLLNAYTLCESEKWNEMYESVTNAESYFQNTYSSSDSDYQDKQRIALAITNLKNTINLNEKNVFYLQYKNIMQMIVTIC